MRLSQLDQETIQATVAELFGADAAVRVFGSRVNDSARGGDIDLLVESPKPVPDRRRKALQLVARLQMRLGDQPIDVLVLDPETERAPIHEEALRSGVRL
ncbi:nucleotidyltransferase domain-containing protein [Thioalkalivibrio sp.]|uniref:nucleotidyltransferase domain-containing protein n=1 Tax=Thioalkalivibrio sp. TaxID=2093813 RepID=UPI003975AD28